MNKESQQTLLTKYVDSIIRDLDTLKTGVQKDVKNYLEEMFPVGFLEAAANIDEYVEFTKDVAESLMLAKRMLLKSQSQEKGGKDMIKGLIKDAIGLLSQEEEELPPEGEKSEEEEFVEKMAKKILKFVKDDPDETERICGLIKSEIKAVLEGK